MKTKILILLCIITVLVVWSCGDDKVTPPTEAPVVEFKNLKTKDDILHNLVLAYNERHYEEYDKLLDDNFVFNFSRADFLSGDTPHHWDRTAEVRSYSLMINVNPTGATRVVSIYLKLDYDADGWIEDPPNPDHPDETWYKKTAGYDLTIKTADNWQARTHGLQAEFTIRWAGTQEDGHWRIVLWRDAV